MKRLLTSSFSFIVLFFVLLLSPQFLTEVSAKIKSEQGEKMTRPEVDKDYVEAIKKDWTYIYEKDNIHVYKKDHKNSPLTAFRGVGIIPVPLDVIFHIVRNVEKSTEWTPNLTEKKMIKEISLVEGITYNVNSLPWPVTDRDTLLHSRLYYDEKKKAFVVSTKSVELPEQPENKNYVRGIVYESSFIFKPVAGGTLIDIDAHIDPKGELPVWLINFIQEEWAYKFFTSLDRFARKGNFQPEPAFTKMMNAYQQGGNIQAIFAQFPQANGKGFKVVKAPKIKSSKKENKGSSSKMMAKTQKEQSENEKDEDAGKMRASGR